MEHTKGIIKQTVVRSSRCGHSGKRSGQWQLTQLLSNTAVQIIHSVKAFLPWYSSMESWTQATGFVILWRGWLVCCCWNDPGFPVVTVTEGEAGRWKRCRYQASPVLFEILYCSYQIWIYPRFFIFLNQKPQKHAIYSLNVLTKK